MQNPLHIPILQNLQIASSALNLQPELWEGRSLGAICFSTGIQISRTQPGNTQPDSFSANAAMPCMHIPAPVLGSEEAACEIWLSNIDALAGRRGAINYRYDDATLFGVIELREADFVYAGHATSLQQATESAYQQIFALLHELNFSYPYRFWNYMADINGISHELERYQQFNIGRQNAFIAHGRQTTGQLPAACALGVAEGSLQIAFIAGRSPSLAIENPRQISAYEYPEQYGPSSPTFARASLLNFNQCKLLLISGTASIVGHQTLHVGDVIAQTHETLNNLKAIVSEANRLLNQDKFDLATSFYRVYLRHAADLPLVRNEMQRVFGNHVQALFLQAEICRQNLLLEIEASIFSAPGSTRQKRSQL